MAKNRDGNKILPLPPSQDKTKTIVLDMDNTLIYRTFSVPPPHYDFTVLVQELQENPTLCYVQKRPAVDELFIELAKNKYEIIIFTSATKEYADEVLNKLDANKSIDHRLYRDSCTRTSLGLLYKDLAKLGRDLKNVFIVDDDPHNYKMQPQNAFPITSFNGGLSDRELWKLIEFCNVAVTCQDVREALRIYYDVSGRANTEIESLRERERDREREGNQERPGCYCGVTVNCRCSSNGKNKTKTRSKRKTIVLGLFDVLIKASFEDNLRRNDFIISVAPHNAQQLPYYVMKRPGVDDLLSELAEDYEIVVFAAAPKNEADVFLDKLDVNMNIKRRLYRASSSTSDNCRDHVKNLGKKALGRVLNVDLKDVIIVDHDEVSRQFDKDNKILLKSFEGDLDDAELYEVMEICKAAAAYDDLKEFRKEVKLRTGNRRQKRSPSCTVQ